MTDEELERLLGCEQVAGPPLSLRARVLHSATGASVRVRLGVFDYATAALAAGLVLLASLMDAPQPTTADTQRQREIAALAGSLGGGPDARQHAELAVLRRGEPEDPALTEFSW